VTVYISPTNLKNILFSAYVCVVAGVQHQVPDMAGCRFPCLL